MARSPLLRGAASAPSASGAGSLLLVGALLTVPGVEADQARVGLTVGARVLPVAELRAPSPPTLRVTAADAVAGYVDWPATAAIEIHTNAGGYVLEVAPLTAPFRAVAIAGLDCAVLIDREGGEIVQRPVTHAQPLTLQLRYRFALEAGAVPGEYPWPLRLRIQPLAQ